jgi:hypothetical protein
MSLALSLTETRLYHDRFNFSGMPLVFQAFRASRLQGGTEQPIATGADRGILLVLGRIVLRPDPLGLPTLVI